MTAPINSKKTSGIPPGRGSPRQELATMTNKQTRRAIMAGAAALPALAAPAFAFEPDPIFAIIDAHKRARAENIAAGKEASRRAEQLRKEGVPFRKILKICDSISDHAADADNAAMAAFLRCEPTTSAGLAAWLAYVADAESDYPDGDTLLAAITTASRAAKRLAA
jgi:hypothetical protein